jgi:hypothetical protein
VAHASQFYGSLAIVIGLLAWIYPGARLTVYAAEVNVELSYRLWPRSLRAGVRTEADWLAYRHQAREAQREVGEEIDVVFISAESQDSPTTNRGETATGSVVTHLQTFIAYGQEAATCEAPEQSLMLMAGIEA